MTEHIGTANNVERTFSRDDLCVSSFLRTLEGVKHIDGDMSQYSEHRKLAESDPMGFGYLTEAIFENTTNRSSKATNYTRHQARINDCYAVLIQHYPSDDDHELPINVTVWSPDNLWGHAGIRHEDISWQELQIILVDIHEDMMKRRGLL